MQKLVWRSYVANNKGLKTEETESTRPEVVVLVYWTKRFKPATHWTYNWTKDSQDYWWTLLCVINSGTSLFHRGHIDVSVGKESWYYACSLTVALSLLTGTPEYTMEPSLTLLVTSVQWEGISLTDVCTEVHLKSDAADVLTCSKMNNIVSDYKSFSWIDEQSDL